MISKLWKLTPIIALTAAIALLLAGVIMALYNERSYKAQTIREVDVQAQILASSVTAALAFDDRETAEEYVSALKANPEVRAVAVYDKDGSLFASYSRAEERPLPETAPTGGPRFEDVYLTVVTPVLQGDTRLGTVYLRTITEPVRQRLARYGGIAVLIVMASLLVSVLGMAQAALGRANKELESRARDLAEANKSLHTQIEEREKAEEALRQAQKMETIGQLTGGVAHDFNNLLTVILGNLERLRRRIDDGGDPAQMKRAADNAIQGAERAASLTRSLLAFSRRQPLSPKPVDVNKLVANMSDLLRRTLGEQITIESVVAGGLWRTHVDPNQLENAILNLAVNARDAMPNGGKLTIETANAYLDARYAADQAEVAPGQYVVLCITDTGIGMSKEVVEQAFEPFFTTKDIGQGTGLGLSQVYGFVKQSGGHVKIYSEPGQGTTVKIYLPRLLADEDAIEIARPSDAPPAGNRSEAILIVEDEEGVRAHSVEIMTELGYRVFQAANGPAALEVLAREPTIALLFTDVGLPGGMNGRQLADEARRRWPNLRVLFTTGYARNAIVHDGRLDPGVQLITKPFTYTELATAVREALDRSADPPGILVVEDEALVRTNLVDVLGDLGFRVLQAATAVEAIQKVRLSSIRIDTALIDLGLPDRKGDALAAELRAMYKHMPIVIASGNAEEAVRKRFAADSLVSFLAKPYSASQLEAALRALGIRRPGASES